MREIAGEDRAVGLAEDGAKVFNSAKRHVNVTEADEAHRAVVTSAPRCRNDGLPGTGRTRGGAGEACRHPPRSKRGAGAPPQVDR